MTLPTSGAISLNTVKNECGLPSDGVIALSKYYRGGSLIPADSARQVYPFLNGIPASGAIALGNFLGRDGAALRMPYRDWVAADVAQRYYGIRLFEDPNAYGLYGVHTIASPTLANALSAPVYRAYGPWLSFGSAAQFDVYFETAAPVVGGGLSDPTNTWLNMSVTRAILIDSNNTPQSYALRIHFRRAFPVSTSILYTDTTIAWAGAPPGVGTTLTMTAGTFALGGGATAKGYYDDGAGLIFGSRAPSTVNGVTVSGMYSTTGSGFTGYFRVVMNGAQAQSVFTRLVAGSTGAEFQSAGATFNVIAGKSFWEWPTADIFSNGANYNMTFIT